MQAAAAAEAAEVAASLRREIARVNREVTDSSLAAWALETITCDLQSLGSIEPHSAEQHETYCNRNPQMR